MDFVSDSLSSDAFSRSNTPCSIGDVSSGELSRADSPTLAVAQRRLRSRSDPARPLERSRPSLLDNALDERLPTLLASLNHAAQELEVSFQSLENNLQALIICVETEQQLPSYLPPAAISYTEAWWELIELQRKIVEKITHLSAFLEATRIFARTYPNSSLGRLGELERQLIQQQAPHSPELRVERFTELFFYHRRKVHAILPVSDGGRTVRFELLSFLRYSMKPALNRFLGTNIQLI